ncbi:MAG: discoidin domain-containing protein [Planctomycetota bacterium]|nr:discoidin domain-containing protein [Planctomycetota bacterium]
MHHLLRLAVVLLLLAAAFVARAGPPRVLDDFEDPARWTVITSEGVTLRLHPDEGAQGRCLRLDYEFVTGAGYGLIQRPLPIDLPADYEFSFRVRGVGPSNNLEFKLLDPSGDSVWWVNRRAFEWPADWTRIAYRTRHLEFAWGPSAGAPLTQMSKLEFAIASASGGKGSVWLDELTFREVPPAGRPTGPPTARASSQASPNASAAMAIDADPRTSWRSAAGDADETLTLRLGATTEFSAVQIDWDDDARPKRVGVETSDDGETWSVLAAESGVRSARTLLVAPDSAAAFVRLTMRGRTGASHVGVREIVLRDQTFAPNPNAMFAALAGEAPRGRYPRACLNEQVYWTVIGAPEHGAEALVSEDGSIELGKRGVSLEPFIAVGESLLTWADARTEQRLADDALPIPTVVRRHDGLDLSVTAFVDGAGDAATTVALYAVTNTSDAPIAGRLHVALRPFQVNPPWQRLNFEGGFSPIRTIRADARSITVNDATTVTALTRPDRLSAVAFGSSDIVADLASGDYPSAPTAADAGGLASGVMTFDFELAPGGTREVVLVCPLVPGAAPPTADRVDAPAWARSRLAAVADAWRTRVSTVQLTLPEPDAWVDRALRSQLAYILINRDGPAIQPGSRSYERSWARDGSLTSAALLSCGVRDEVRTWIDWYASHQFESGKIPCVVDARGPDPVPEHDSHGEYIWAVAHYYRYTRDTEFLAAHWPRVQKAAAYIGSLRAQRMTPEYQQGEKRRFYGLVPESISHEGYSAKPMHSHWDNFFCVLGLREASFIAREMGDGPAEAALAAQAADMRRCLYDSIRLTTREKNLTYIPGCVELYDFDSTSTTIALFPCDDGAHAPQDLLRGTFDKYWDFFTARAAPGATWDAYTPYELRHVGTYVRLGQPERAIAALRWFHGHMRPAGWNHWAEVVFREARTPKFIGDMPHTWVGSDFVNAVLSIFVHEQDDACVVFGGVIAEWLGAPGGVAFRNITLPGGTLSGSMRRDAARVIVTLEGDATIPPGGFIVRRPPGALGNDATVRSLPATVMFDVAP